MVTQELIQRLIEACEKHQAADSEIQAICRQIAEAGEAAGLGEPRKIRRGGRGKPVARPGRADRKPQYRPNLHVKCSVCGKVTSGGKLIGDKMYPYRHADPGETGICNGSDQPGTPE